MSSSPAILLMGPTASGKTELAIGILESEADAGKLDRDLLDLFIEARVFQHGIVN